MLQANDRVTYVDVDGRLLGGRVVKVTPWQGGKEGCTYAVEFDDESTGQIRSDSRYLFKQGAQIPQAILDEFQ